MRLALLLTALLLLASCDAMPPHDDGSTQSTVRIHTTPVLFPPPWTPTPAAHIGGMTPGTLSAECPRLVLIEDGLLNVDGTERKVLSAQWLTDTQLLFASTADIDYRVAWSLLDISTFDVSDAMPPVTLSSDEPCPSGPSSAELELRGHVSPTGAYAICSEAEYESDYVGRTRVFLYFSSADELQLIADEPAGYLARAQWLPDGTSVIFDLTREGGTSLYQAFPFQKILVTLTDDIPFDLVSGQEWSLSPDGSTIAAIDNDATLNLIELRDGTVTSIARPAMQPTFSSDGNDVYFYRGTTLQPETADLMAYNRASHTTDAIFLLSDLERASHVAPSAAPPTSGGDYAVSPNHRSVALWGGWLWLLQFCD